MIIGELLKLCTFGRKTSIDGIRDRLLDACKRRAVHLVFPKGNGGLKYRPLGNEWTPGIENVVCDVTEGLDVIAVVLVVCCLLEGI